MSTTKTKSKGLTEPIKRVPTQDHQPKRARGKIWKALPVYNDQADFDAYIKVLGDFENESSRTRPRKERLDVLQEEMGKALIALEATTDWYVFRSIGRRAYEEILKDHPATEEQQAEEAKKAQEAGRKPQHLPYNGDTFGPALVQASCVYVGPKDGIKAALADPDVGPVLSDEEVEEIFDEWNMSEIIAMFTTAMEVCTTSRLGDLGNAYGGMASS